MAYIVTLRGVRPRIGKHCFLAETAVIIGDVEIGDNCSIWYGAVLRGDVGRITVGNGVNIQDGAVVHSTAGVSVVEIGDGVSVGHNAIVHGAHVGQGAWAWGPPYSITPRWGLARWSPQTPWCSATRRFPP